MDGPLTSLLIKSFSLVVAGLGTLLSSFLKGRYISSQYEWMNEFNRQFLCFCICLTVCLSLSAYLSVWLSLPACLLVILDLYQSPSLYYLLPTHMALHFLPLWECLSVADCLEYLGRSPPTIHSFFISGRSPEGFGLIGTVGHPIHSIWIRIQVDIWFSKIWYLRRQKNALHIARI